MELPWGCDVFQVKKEWMTELGNINNNLFQKIKFKKQLTRQNQIF